MCDCILLFNRDDCHDPVPQLAGNMSMTDQLCNVQPIHRHTECFHCTLPIVDWQVESELCLIRVEYESKILKTRLDSTRSHVCVGILTAMKIDRLIVIDD